MIANKNIFLVILICNFVVFNQYFRLMPRKEVNLTPFKYKNELYFIYTFTFNSATRLFQGFLSQLDIKPLKIHIKSAG